MEPENVKKHRKHMADYFPERHILVAAATLLSFTTIAISIPHLLNPGLASGLATQPVSVSPVTVSLPEIVVIAGGAFAIVFGAVFLIRKWAKKM